MKKQVSNLYQAGYCEQHIKEIMFGMYGIFHSFYGHQLTPDQTKVKSRIIKTINQLNKQL